MRVILLQKVAGVGKIDDVKEVADGYARNFLFPHHLAVQASEKALQDLKAQKAKQVKEETNDLQTQQNLAQKLSGLSLEFKAKASDKGQLYAAVTATTIANDLKKRGIIIDKDQITMEHIKEPGEFTALVKLRHGLEAEITINVLSQ